MIMEEIKEKKFIIEAEGEVPFAQRTGDGYELFNNERTMKFCARRQQIRNNETGEQKSCFAVFCFVKEDDGWVQGDNYHQTETITSFVKDLNISPYFTKAVEEYRKQMDITEEWKVEKWEQEKY
nr:MAG TPA: hypothetical protein [Caudoviricetes sp.]DAU86963.1 MAG TPA: hypothetical protein [Caudoviricetes sp.]